ncbi:MAG: RAMP superfamily CRISPR-associated protein [Oscillospiraceae bacterium]|jgi:CRISPR/Cas system CSM-associated protein Csm3 (group 7 of RAMP superfamily)|nr:RAMP superfamily CRISPR-associated protein [Oscillospiraceae bacterium]
MSEKLTVKRVYAVCKMRLEAPALIGTSEDIERDRDVALNKDGNPFIPGTTLAGILRSSLTVSDADTLFGKRIRAKGDEIKQSPLWVYDAEIFNGQIITIDNVSLDENQRNAKIPENPELDHMNKSAKNEAKFDMQAVDKGAEFDLRLCLIVRDGDTKTEILLARLLETLNNLYVGGKTSRGFGKLSCFGVYKHAFDFTGADKQSQMDAWLAFEDWKTLETDEYRQDLVFIPPVGVSTLSAKLTLNGAVLVRDIYSVEDDEDFAHTKSAGSSVIYGTSWAGALRGGLARLFKSNGYESAEAFLDSVFGRQYGDKAVTEPSKIRVDASYISGGERLIYSRNKIDRFTGGTANTALFTNRPHFGGKTILTVQFKTADVAIRELLLLALDALNKGLITLGGETSIGRGVFTVGRVSLDGQKAQFGAKPTALKEALSHV